MKVANKKEKTVKKERPPVKEKPPFPAQRQKPPGLEYKMDPEPHYETPYPGSNRLKDKVCVVTGGDSGIGRAVSIAFAKEGADVAVLYLSEDADAKKTEDIIRNQYGRDCLLIRADFNKEKNCVAAIQKVIKRFQRIDVLVNNAAVQYDAEGLEDISSEQLMETFAVNILAMFWLTKAALPYMKRGCNIINTSSVTAYRGSPHLLDYSTTKGAIISFTRSLAANLMEKGIRVNAVAPGPVWTPLVPTTFKTKKIKEFGSQAPMERPAQPGEIAPAYVFLACEDASYISGQVIHPNGGEIINT
jgi:NAD(P)-dependent dehydrogenase (short-subunit alcohol dehydrogenase family)